MSLVHFTFDGGDVVANLRSCERLVYSTTGDLSCEDHGSWLIQGYEMEMGEDFRCRWVVVVMPKIFFVDLLMKKGLRVSGMPLDEVFLQVILVIASSEQQMTGQDKTPQGAMGAYCSCTDAHNTTRASMTDGWISNSCSM